jgi:hypothetical protein
VSLARNLGEKIKTHKSCPEGFDISYVDIMASETGTFQEVMNKMIQPINNSLDGKEHMCVNHCYRGNPSGGRLWTIWDSGVEKWIALFVLRKLKGSNWQWTVHMEKHIPVHLNAIDCPLKYLDLVPCPKDKNAAQWRARVYSYHNNRVAKRLAKKAVVEL